MIPTMSPWTLNNPPPELPLQAERSAWMRRVSTVWRKVFVFPSRPKAIVGPPAERIAHGEDLHPRGDISGGERCPCLQLGSMLFGDTVDHDIHKRAVTDEVGREFVEIIGENANVLLDDGARRGVVFLRGVSGGNHVAIPQVKPGSPDDDFSRFLRRALTWLSSRMPTVACFSRRNVPC